MGAAVSLRDKLTKGQTAGIVQPKLSHPLHVILVPPLGLRWKNYRKRSSAIHGVDTRHKNELTRHFGVYWWLLVVVLAAGTFSNRQDPITVESDKGKWELIWRVFVQMEFEYESDLLSEKWQKSLDKRGISGHFWFFHSQNYFFQLKKVNFIQNRRKNPCLWNFTKGSL